MAMKSSKLIAHWDTCFIFLQSRINFIWQGLNFKPQLLNLQLMTINCHHLNFEIFPVILNEYAILVWHDKLLAFAINFNVDCVQDGKLGAPFIYPLLRPVWDRNSKIKIHTLHTLYAMFTDYNFNQFSRIMTPIPAKGYPNYLSIKIIYTQIKRKKKSWLSPSHIPSCMYGRRF